VTERANQSLMATEPVAGRTAAILVEESHAMKPASTAVPFGSATKNFVAHCCRFPLGLPRFACMLNRRATTVPGYL